MSKFPAGDAYAYNFEAIGYIGLENRPGFKMAIITVFMCCGSKGRVELQAQLNQKWQEISWILM